MIIKVLQDLHQEDIKVDNITNIINGYLTVTVIGGEYVIAQEESRVAIKTLLGSCVALMLYDKTKQMIAMNHFLLPDTDSNNQSLKYGLFSAKHMLENMLKLGAKKENIVAKIAGGGNVTKKANDIGLKNIQFAQQFCQQEEIPIISEHIGSNDGRIVLLAHDFTTFIRVIKNRAIVAELESNSKNVEQENV